MSPWARSMQSLRLAAAGLLEAVDCHKLAEQSTESKRMLTALIQKLNAKSLPPKACAKPSGG